MTTLTIFSRPGCHLCDDMKAVVSRAVRAAGVAVAIHEVDISTDPALEARYGLEIPVLLVEGKKAAKYRVSELDVIRMLNARADRSRESSGSGGRETI